jgi:hypothetical protein
MLPKEAIVASQKPKNPRSNKIHANLPPNKKENTQTPQIHHHNWNTPAIHSPYKVKQHIPYHLTTNQIHALYIDVSRNRNSSYLEEEATGALTPRLYLSHCSQAVPVLELIKFSFDPFRSFLTHKVSLVAV